MEFVSDNKSNYSVAKMCDTLKINSSTYYRSKHKKLTSHYQRDVWLKGKIKSIHTHSKGIYGSPRITKELQIQGVQTSQKRVSRLMKDMNIRSMIKIKYKSTTDSKHQYNVAPNLLDRDFRATRSAEKWVSDITYIPTFQGWLYLTVIIDLYDRKIIGWSMSNDLTTKQTIVPAWIMATRNRPIIAPLIFHSDRGVQYASKEFDKCLKPFSKVRKSMSRKGNCWDNAVAESFFKTLKTEWIYRHNILSKKQTRNIVFEYIETFYNKNRRHKHLNNLTITEFNNFNHYKYAA